MMTLFLKIISLRERLSRKDLARFGIPVMTLALVASVVAGREKPSEAVPPVAAPELRASEPELDLSQLFRVPQEAKIDAANDPFGRRSFAPAQQAGAPQTAAAPAVPPLPFKYLGKAIEDGKLSVFLARGAESYSVQSKQKLDEQYRVDKVTESNVTFTYLPMNQKQVLEIQ
jgi:acyl transferase domain-containing protein